MIGIKDFRTHFWSRITIGFDTECWVWNGFRGSNGYGKTGVPGDGTKLAHRVAWTLEVGEIPKGLHALHTCDNPSCVNWHGLM